MGSKLFPEFLTKSSKSHAEVTKSNKRLVGPYGKQIIS